MRSRDSAEMSTCAIIPAGGRELALLEACRPAQGLMGTQARSVHLAGHTATREHNLYHQILCSVYHMFPRMLVIVLLRATMGALPWSARGSKQRVLVRETKKIRRKRARSRRAPRVCSRRASAAQGAECTLGHAATRKHNAPSSKNVFRMQHVCAHDLAHAFFVFEWLPAGIPRPGHARTPGS